MKVILTDKKIVFRIWLTALLAVYAPISPAQTCAITPTEENIALSSGDIRGLGPGGSIDASISTFSRGNARYWIFPMARATKGKAIVNHVITEGTVDDLDRRVIGSWPQEALFGETPGLKWITNTYEDKEGVLAFVHTEYALPGEYFGATITGRDGKKKRLPGPGHSRIGLVWYEKPDPEGQAPQFHYLGHIVAPFDELRFEAWNVHGTPYIIHHDGGEDWFYIYFFDTPETGGQGHVAAARARVEDVLVDAKAGRVGAWEKYHDGTWTPALSGPSSPITGEHTIVHSDAVRSRDGRYFFTTTAMNKFRGKNNPSAIVVYTACDPLEWEEIGRLHPISLPAVHANGRRNVGWQYVTILNADGTDTGEVGSEFIILVGRQHNKPEREIRRFRYALTGDCSCPIP